MKIITFHLGSTIYLYFVLFGSTCSCHKFIEASLALNPLSNVAGILMLFIQNNPIIWNNQTVVLIRNFDGNSYVESNFYKNVL